MERVARVMLGVEELVMVYLLNSSYSTSISSLFERFLVGEFHHLPRAVVELVAFF